MFERRQQLGFGLGSDLVQDRLQSADTRRERIGVVLNDGAKLRFESGGLLAR